MEQKEFAAPRLTAAASSAPVISVKMAAHWMTSAGGTLSVEQTGSAAPQLMAALPVVHVLKEREIVKRTQIVEEPWCVATTTVISRARLLTAAAPLLPGAQ